MPVLEGCPQGKWEEVLQVRQRTLWGQVGEALTTADLSSSGIHSAPLVGF